MQSVLKIEQTETKAGPVFGLVLACGHVKKVTPFDEKKNYQMAPNQKRAKCNICDKDINPAGKECSICGEFKTYSEFYKARGCSDGHGKHCKPCRKIYIAGLNAKRPLSIAAEYSRSYKAKFPKRFKARSMINSAIARGAIVRPETCQECGLGGEIQGHHDDYDKPYDVRWLCRTCHDDWHRMFGPGLNAD